MNLLSFNLFAALRQRLGAVLLSFAGGAACCLCGALLAFVLAPRQALQAVNVSRLPQMDAATVGAAAPGDTLLITGALVDNAILPPTTSYVAYWAERFTVRTPAGDEDGESQPSGSWVSQGSTVPNLTLEVGGQTVQVLAADNARVTGPLPAEEFEGTGPTAVHSGEAFADGTMRYHGLSNGDLTTVLGQKAASGGVIPEQLFLGDRVAFQESERQATSGLLISGICAMALAPAVVIGGILFALLGRRR